MPADVTRVDIPVRLPTNGADRPPMGVEVMDRRREQGPDAGRRQLGDHRACRLPAAVPPTRFKRIDLKVDRTWQPALYIAGSADMRIVGVQVGELRLVRE